MTPLTFAEALRETQQLNRRHALLGNGFSIACRPNIFTYEKLFEQADFSQISAMVKKVFIALSTQDFERVIKAIETQARSFPVTVDPQV